MLTCISRELQKYQISKGLKYQLRGERNQGFLQLRLKKRDDLTRRIIIADRLAVKKTPLLSSSYSRWYAFLFFALYFPILHDLLERETTQVHLFWFWWRFTIIFPNGWFVHIFFVGIWLISDLVVDFSC